MGRLHAALVSVQVLFALWPVVGAALLEVMPPMALVFARLFLAAPVLVVAARLHRRPLPRALDLLKLAGLGALGISLNQVFFITGLARSGPVNASVFVMLIPPFTVAIGVLLGLERVRPLRLAGIALALGGAALLVEIDRFDTSNAKSVGNAILFLNCACYAAYLVLARKTIARLGALVTIAWVMALGALETLPVTLAPALHVAWRSFGVATYLELAFIVIGPTVLTYLLNGYALRHADSSLVAVYVYVQPPIAAVASYLAFAIVPSVRTLWAALLIFFGVALSTGLSERLVTRLRRPTS